MSSTGGVAQVCLQRSVNNFHRACTFIHKTLSCGGEPVARCAHAKFRLNVEVNALRMKILKEEQAQEGEQQESFNRVEPVEDYPNQ
jgi:hypothetical protein